MEEASPLDEGAETGLRKALDVSTRVSDSVSLQERRVSWGPPD